MASIDYGLVVMAELYELSLNLEFVWELGKRRVIVEVDNEVIIKKVKRPNADLGCYFSLVIRVWIFFAEYIKSQNF